MYRINPGFSLKKIVDDYIVIATGEKAVSFSSVLVLNDVGVKVFQQLQEGRSPEEIAQSIAAEYDIPAETAYADAMCFIEKMIGDGVCSHE